LKTFFKGPVFGTAGNALSNQLEVKMQILEKWAHGVQMLVGAKQAEG